MATGSQAPISTVDLLDPFGDGSGVALYKFDGDATDTGGAFNGTASNVTYTTGKFGQCGVFNGSSSKVQLPQEVFQSTGAVSVSVWFNTVNKAVDGFDEFMFSKRNGILTFCIWINTEGKVQVVNWDRQTLTSLLPKTDGIWHNAIFTLENNNGKLYIDGILEVTYNSMTIYTQSFASANSIGSFDNYARYFSGSIDQVRIFNRALTATEVTALYNEGQ